MDELLSWCAAKLRRYDVRAAFLPASDIVRVLVQMDPNGKRRVPLRDAQEGKLVGEAWLNPCQPATEPLEQATLGLLRRLCG